MKVFYISDAIVLKEWLKYNNEHLAPNLYFTCDVEVGFYFDARGIKYINGWDLIDAADIERNWNLAHLLSENWLSEVVEFEEVLGFNPLTCAQQDLVYPFESALNAITIFNNLINKYEIKNFEGVCNKIVPMLRTGPSPGFISSNSIAEAVFHHICLTKKINFSVQRINNNYQGKYSARNWSGKLPQDKYISGQGCYDHLVLVFRDGMPFEEYYKLVNAINSRAGWRAMTITRESLSDCYSDENKDEQIYSIFRQAEQDWRAINVELIEKYSEIFGNVYLEFQFEKIRQELIFSIIAGIRLIKIIETTGAESIIFGHAAFTFERLLCRVANHKRIDTTELLHGGAGLKLLFRGLVGESARIFVWNDIDRSLLNRYGISSNRTKIHTPFRNIGSASENSKKNTKGTILRGNRKIITIITTAINCGLSAPLANASGHIAGINELIRLMKDHPELDFTIRPHPNYDYYNIYGWISELGYENLVHFSNLKTSEVIKESSLCIMFNYYSSAAIECFKLGVPVIFYDESVFKLPDWVPCYDVLDRKIVTSKNYQELLEAINLILNSNQYNLECIDSGNAIYNHLFPTFGKENDDIFRIGDRKLDGSSNLTLTDNQKIKFNKFQESSEYWCRGANNSISVFRVSVDNFYCKKKSSFLRVYFIGAFQSNEIKFQTTFFALVFFTLSFFSIEGFKPIKRASWDYLVLRFGFSFNRLLGLYSEKIQNSIRSIRSLGIKL